MSTHSQQSYELFVAEYYDHIPLYAQRADVPFYVEMGQAAGGPVLELGCGSGRILIPTAAAGCRIVGLDLSEPMLAKCRERLAEQPRQVQQRARVLCRDMTRFELGETFSLVTTPFRSFQHLITVEQQLACLRCARGHLQPGGRIILDMFQVNPQAIFDPAWQQEREDTPEQTLRDGRKFRRTRRVVAFHRAQQVNEVELAYYVTHPDGRQERLAHVFPMRYFYPFEVEHLLARAGFRLRHVFGGFDRSPLRDDSQEMIFVAQKEEE